MRFRSWSQALSVYAQPTVLGMIFLGFSAGLPFLLVFSTLSAWLSDMQVSHTLIGYFSWVGIAYSLKVIWAPVVDHLPLPILSRVFGKRRSWLLLSQIGIVLGLLGMAETGTAALLWQMAVLAFAVAFCSATQDIVIDAYRIESADSEFQGAMAAMYVLGYRLALLVAGAGAFYVADFSDWTVAYYLMAALMAVGIVATLLIAEPEHTANVQAENLERRIEASMGGASPLAALIAWLVDAFISPFVEFFQRNGAKAFLILALIAVYKLSDMTMGVMANPFYLDLGFSKTEIAEVTKIFGFFMTIFGASLGGLLVLRFGLLPSLLLGAVLVVLTNLLFALLAVTEPNLWLLAGVISADNLSGGIAASVFIAYLSSLTNTAYTATQYALFSSLMTLPAKIIGGFSGQLVEAFGYEMFFVCASAIGLPAVGLVVWLMKNKA